VTSAGTREKRRRTQGVHAAADEELDGVSAPLLKAGLGSASHTVKIHTFRARDLDSTASFWHDAFQGAPPRFLSPPPLPPDLITGATESHFVLCLRDGLSNPERAELIRHGVAHIALGHVRLGDQHAHADALDGSKDGRPRRRWDRQVDQVLAHHKAPVLPVAFAAVGLTEALSRLISGDVDPPETSAVVLLQSCADELVDVPHELAERAQLFPHQERGLAELAARLRRFNAAILADSVGLGKTRTACALVRALRDTGHITRAAIVTPRKLVRNWLKEMSVVGLQAGDEVVLINKDQLKRLTSAEAASTFRGCDLVIVEEAHQDLRNPGNRFYRNVRDGVGLAPGLLVTATPWNNRRGDIFALLAPFVRTTPGAAGGAFECFKKGIRTGRREFEESDEVFNKVYALTVLQRTRRQLRDQGNAGVFYAPRAPRLDVVPYTEEHQLSFRKLLSVVEALKLPYFNPVRFLTSENDAEWRLSGIHRFFLLKRAESSMAAFRLTLQGMRERASRLRQDLMAVEETEDAIARWLAGVYRIDEEVLEAARDVSHEGGLLAEHVTRPRQRRVLRLIDAARSRGQLMRLRSRLLGDCEADVRLLNDVERDFADLFEADPKLDLVRRTVSERLTQGRKVLLISQFADTAFSVYKSLLGEQRVREKGIGLVMSTAKGAEPAIQVNGREARRDEALRRFAPRAWEQTSIEAGQAAIPAAETADPEIEVLIGTDTIAVGQNLQDARTLLHLDLTWNPMMLEQRIGRLDRPRHETDSEPIEVRYFVNLDLIETELELRKRIDARLEGTYRDTAFDDEILPGYFEVIERMRKLRAERADGTEIAREVDVLIAELASARPTDVPSARSVEDRRAALNRLQAACAHVAELDPVPPLVVTLGTSESVQPEAAAQVEFQALDNNGRIIGSPECHLVTVVGSSEARLDELPIFVDAVLQPPWGRSVIPNLARMALERLDESIRTFAGDLKRERNRLRDERRRVRERTLPSWLGPLIRKLRALIDQLPDAQYATFLGRWGLTDEAFGSWLDALRAGIDLDETELVERFRRLESDPGALLYEFGSIRDVVATEEDGAPLGLGQLELDVEPVVHGIEARVTNVRLNLVSQVEEGVA
jgi:hypothetical protein